MTNTEKTFRGVVRFKDNTKHVVDINNVDTWQEAQEFLKTHQNVVTSMVLIPKEYPEVEKELA